MFWKKTYEAEKRIMQMNELLKKSFANVKKDTGNIFQWLNYFQKKISDQELMIRKLQIELSYVPKTREEIRRIIDDYYSFESILSRVREMDSKLNDLIIKHYNTEAEKPVWEAPKETHIDYSSIEKRLNSLEQKKLSIKEKIVKRLTKNSKEYVKGIILSYIKKYERISALQLKEIVVDEQSFCSKSSFYRLLEEVEQLEDLSVIRKGKEKLYISKSIRQLVK